MAHICITWTQWVNHFNSMDGLVQERCISIANALELCLSCTNPLIWFINTIILYLQHDNDKCKIGLEIVYLVVTDEWWRMLYEVFLGKLPYYMERSPWVNIMHKIYEGMKAYLIFIASIKKFCHAVYMTWLQIQWHTQKCQQTWMILSFFHHHIRLE